MDLQRPAVSDVRAGSWNCGFGDFGHGLVPNRLLPAYRDSYRAKPRAAEMADPSFHI